MFSTMFRILKWESGYMNTISHAAILEFVIIGTYITMTPELSYGMREKFEA
jgi:hypothetical protein